MTSPADTPMVPTQAPPRTRAVSRDRPGARRRARMSWRDRVRRDWQMLLMVAPAMIILLVFTYVPLLGNIIAFQDYSPFIGILDSPFVGLAHFERMFGSDAFWRSVVNTLMITTAQLIFFFPVPIVLALLLNSLISERAKATVQAVIYLPYFFSWVLVVTLFQQIFGGAGVIATFMRQQGWQPIDLMTNPDTFIALITAQAVWKDAGWSAIVFLAALSTVDVTLYEAAAVDGAGRWRRLWHVTLPALRPVIVLMLILRLGNSLNVGFEQVLLQRDAVGARTAEVLDTYVYYTGLVNADWAYGAAAGLFKGAVGLALVLAANKVAHMLGDQGVYAKR